MNNELEDSSRSTVGKVTRIGMARQRRMQSEMGVYEPPPMTLHELVRMLKSPEGAAILGRGIADVVEEEQLLRGCPISYVQDGWVVREFPNGRLERLAKI